MQRHLSLAVRVGLGAALGAAFLWWVWRDVDNQALYCRLLDFPTELLFPVLGLVVVSAAVRACRWRLLFFMQEAPPGLVRLFFVENTGVGINSVSPLRVLAEPIQFAYLVIRDGHDRGAVLASLVLVRVIDLVVTLASIAVGFTVFRPSADVPRAVWVSMAALTGVVVAIVIVSLTTPGSRRLRRWAFVAAYGNAWRQLVARPGRLAGILLVTMLQWGLLGAAAWAIARGSGVDLSLPLAHVLMLAVFTMGLTLPGLPSGLGPFEFAAVLFLSLYGFPREPALAFGLIVHGTFLFPSIVIAIATLVAAGPPWSGWRPARRSPADV